ncbi:MAG: M20/M25/M40 family metallo-hydrolase [Clostridia bacterium]|nr:M20/M25/M40 family metallo-hydrolase [Clostridia bacterium]
MDRILLERIESWVDEHFEELLRDLEALIRIPSVARYDDQNTPCGEDCQAALRFMCRLAETFGLQSSSVGGLVAEIADRFTDGGIALWNHLDVVPPGEGWMYTTPFEPLRLGDYLIGRGADDNKGPAMASLYILRMFKELGVEWKHGLRLCLGTDEEQRMSDARHYSATQTAAKLNVIADCGFPVCYGEKGIFSADIVSNKPLRCISSFVGGTGKNIVPDRAEMTLCSPPDEMTVTARGVSAHSAYPDRGENAIGALCREVLQKSVLQGDDEAVVRFFAAVCSENEGRTMDIAFRDSVSGQTSCVGTMVSLDREKRAVLSINIRYSITADADEMRRRMEAVCRAHGCALLNAEDSPPSYYSPDAPEVAALTRVYNELSGADAKPYVMAGGTYARRLPNALGFGLGGLKKPETNLFRQGHGAFHQPDEALYVPNLKKAMPILAMGLLEADRVL